MDKDCPKPDMETIFHNLHGISCFGKNDLLDKDYKINLDEVAKKVVQSTHRQYCSRYAGYLRA